MVKTDQQTALKEIYEKRYEKERSGKSIDVDVLSADILRYFVLVRAYHHDYFGEL